ncbi:hypothetical protein TSUD_279790 [Trifolium subterraneum]|uniref:Retrotransposon gag domain-containing protein n=1 Tax=Trifolium subterraneum TaxID=3900 RepID=A0A2Z6MPK2_TRISU|nr:hypothetical protein TSUD_279790 [Trifolium subterraneum]
MAANHGNPSLQSLIQSQPLRQSLWDSKVPENFKSPHLPTDSDDESLIQSQPLRQSLWDSKVPENFKSPHLPTFDGKTDPVEHLLAMGTQTAIIGAPEHLRCKLLSGTLKDAALRWYMNVPNNSIESYADFHKKFIHQFSKTKHVKVTATSLFTIRQNYPETIREYLARFSEATITVSNPNQEMFVAAFHNRLEAGHFNESLAQKPAISMQEVIKRASCYIKGEESNAEKRSRDAKEKDSRNNNSKGRYPADIVYTPLNRARVHVLHKILQAGLAPLPPPRMHNTVMGPDTEGEGDGRNKGEKQQVAVNTISGGFAGGGESNLARKRYVRKSRFEVCSVGSSIFPHTPEISFNPGDARDVIPHDDDPLDAYKAMRLSDEQLNPYSGTLVGFAGEKVEVMSHITLYTTSVKCQAIINMRSPTTNGANNSTFQVFILFRRESLSLLRHIEEDREGKTLYLYLAVSEKALGSVLVQEVEGEENPIYFVSRTLRGAETRYQKIERLCLAVIITACKLRQYFQSHQVGAIKSQALADFVLELTDPPNEGETQPWTLSVDGSSNLRGSGAGVVLEEPEGVLIEQSMKWSYHTTPHSSTGEPPFTMVYGADAMIPVEIQPSTWRRDTLTLQENNAALEESLDLLLELREKAHFREFYTKQSAARKYNTRVIPRKFKAGGPMTRSKTMRMNPALQSLIIKIKEKEAGRGWGQVSLPVFKTIPSSFHISWHQSFGS